MNVPINSFFLSNVISIFNVNSGQECQIHVELISMSITDFSYSQVGPYAATVMIQICF